MNTYRGLLKLKRQTKPTSQIFIYSLMLFCDIYLFIYLL